MVVNLINSSDLKKKINFPWRYFSFCQYIFHMIIPQDQNRRDVLIHLVQSRNIETLPIYPFVEVR